MYSDLQSITAPEDNLCLVSTPVTPIDSATISISHYILLFTAVILIPPTQNLLHFLCLCVCVFTFIICEFASKQRFGSHSTKVLDHTQT